MAFAGRLQLMIKIWLLILHASLSSAACSVPPIPIRIGNVTLSTGEIARGLDLSVGNPEQHFAFLPQWPLNNSFIYGTDGFCGSSWSTAACTTFRGGSYNEFASKSRGVPATNAYPSDASPYPQLTMVSDNITLSSNVSMLDFPIGIPKADWGEQSYYPQMAIGLGTNSTILNTLYSSGQIASRTWSMFWGRTGATSATQLDGGFVFGGYDRAKVTGANYTRSLTYSKTSCFSGMLVTITNMVLNFPNGTDASIFGGIESDAIQACIEPSYPVLLTIPTDPYFLNFEEITNQTISDRSFGMYYYGLLYGGGPRDSTPYAGDLTIELDSGISVRIPNDQLIVPNLSIDHTSGAIVANASEPELVLNAIQAGNANDLPQLGRQFLTAAYLMLNQDAKTFTLWEANPTENEDLVAVDGRNNPMDDFCTSPSTPNNNSANGDLRNSNSTLTPTSTSAADSQSSGKVSTGLIVGAAIGSVAVISIIGGILIWYISQKKRKRNLIAEAAVATNMAEKHPPGYHHSYADQIQFPHYIPQELHAKPVPVIARHELHSQPARANEAHELP
ncbi:uncharacterized protein EAF01_008893 [Botrytis porri]|uniref:Peptidase A1 domain-containing protein n=1 Tax=Botrytis porri TaxID=87229 RepID=A0A4Z1KPK6_9HELO|nr:uncharacterized protein EAF01_008893 [Botrytis porri]KAF7897927.1 hypothetical protein EAF01_008893 [Botrytis porri]TGO83359.1 hypothetical protein BPOR_0659g00030 [Botrytis porri]